MMGVGQGTTLQATLSASSAASSRVSVVPHHPITCSTSELRFEEDGTFRCEHASVPPDDPRTRDCVVHSVAILIIELAAQL